MTKHLVLLALAACGAAAPPATTASERTTAARDPRIQTIVDEELARAVREWSPEAAFVMVMDRRTGELVAVAGSPDGRVPVERAYVTGSTLKTFTIAIALAAHAISDDDRFDCATRLYRDGELVDSAPHAMLSVPDILTESSNVGASRIADRLGLAALVAGLRQFHFGAAPAPLPTVADGTLQAGMFAAGELAEATPLQVLAAYATIFNDGRYVGPGARDGERAIDPAVARRMVAMLEEAVAHGTGAAAQIAGHRVAGKTGTAGLANDRAYASFFGEMLDGPSLVIAVGLVAPERGGTGPSAAAPVFARVAQRLLAR